MMATNDINNHPLLHNDSQDSSGYFSHDNSEQSLISFKDDSDLNLDVESPDNELLCNSEDLNVKNVCYADKLECDDMQECRKTRRKSDVSTFFLSPARPGPAADMWSYGCLLAEVLTGRKLFQVGDKMASVLRPAQLLEMKLGDTEAVWTDKGHHNMFHLFKDLILLCITSDQSNRITAQAALSHPVFLESPDPGVKDLFLLPSPHLQFSQFSSPVSAAGQYDEHPDHDIVLQDLKTQCSAYGEISECSLANSGHAFVHFEEV